MTAGIVWPNNVYVSGSLRETDPLQDLLDLYAQEVRKVAIERSVPEYRVPLFGACSFYMFLAADGLYVAITRAAGLARMHADSVPGTLSEVRASAPKWLMGQTGETAHHVVEFPTPEVGGHVHLNDDLIAKARAYVTEMEFELLIGDQMDLADVYGIEAEFKSFLADHPEVDKNVFIMMSFAKSDHMTQVFKSIQATVSAFGLVAVRADDRAYSEDVWPNIRVYMAGCKFGIAVFEDIDKREFNPNVAMEFGYMMAKGKRVLPLKEQRLPKLPSDLVSRIYREWDSYRIDETVGDAVRDWLTKDLRIDKLP